MRRNRALILGALLLFSYPLGSLAGDGIVALQTAAPSCPDASTDTYVNCGNGTVTDNRTGLVWLKNANCLSGAPGGGEVDWYTAMEFAAGLASGQCGLTDGSSPGEWRLPTFGEWAAMVDDANGGPGDLTCSPTITSDGGETCWDENDAQCAFLGTTCSFTDVQPGRYWGAQTLVADPSIAWFGALDSGLFGWGGKHLTYYVWPVRGGQ